MLSKPEPLPSWWQRKRKLGRVVQRVALPGSSLYGAIVGLTTLAGVSVLLSVILAATNPSELAAILTVGGVVAGAFLAIVAALVQTYLGSVLKHARLLRGGFFEPVAQCKVLEERDGTVVVYAYIDTPPPSPDLPPSHDLVPIGKLELFGYAFGHFSKYRGMSLVWEAAASAVQDFNSKQTRALQEIGIRLAREFASTGFKPATTFDPNGVPSPGEFYPGVGALTVSRVLRQQEAERDETKARFHLDERTDRSPSTLVLDGRPFVRNRSDKKLPIADASKIIETVIAEGSRDELFSERSVERAALEGKIGDVRLASKLVATHIAAADWIDGMCDAGL